MKRFSIFLVMIALWSVACSGPTLTVNEQTGTRTAKGTSVATEATATSDSLLTVIKNRAPKGAVVADSWPEQGHVEAEIPFGERPPFGGVHHPAWQNCGVYTTPVRPEHGVHSLEHGVVWITYREDISTDEIAALTKMAKGDSYMLLSPYPSQKSPIVVTAWAVYLEVEKADDPRIEEFIKVFNQGPQTPEPGAVCTNGTSTTMMEPTAEPTTEVVEEK